MKNKTLEVEIATAEMEYGWVKRDLMRAAQTLADKMQALAQELSSEAPNADPRVNELGEVQSMGRDVDRLCVLLNERRRLSKALRKVAEAEEVLLDKMQKVERGKGTVLPII